LPPFALQIVVLAGGAVLMVTVTVGRLVVVDVILTMVRLVFVLVGVGFDLKSVNENASKYCGKALQQ
jgi:hydrogenase maturation factor